MSNQEIEKLNEAVDSLNRRIADLEAQLRSRADSPTMKRHQMCPGCGGRRILHAERIVADPIHGEKTSQPLSPAIEAKWWGSAKAVAPFEVFACARCGLTEWYITDPAAAAKKLRLIEGETPSSGPFR